MKKRVLAIFLAVALAIGMLPTALANGGGGSHKPPEQEQTPSEGCVGHIDIGTQLSVTIGTETFKFELTEDEVKAASISAAKNDGSPVAFKTSGEFGTSTDDAGNPQIRVEGDFPVGTPSDPVNYTVTITKRFTLNNGQTVPVTLSVTVSYWSNDNICPGLSKDYQTTGNISSNSGIDLELGQTSAVLTLTKVVEGVTLTEPATFTFDVKDSNGNVVKDGIEITVPAGSTTAVVIVAPLAIGTYTVEEVSSATIAGYRLVNTTYSPERVTIQTTADTASLTVTNTYEADTITIPVSKVWNDDENHDGKRPESITVKLMNGETEVKSLTLPIDGKWEGQFTGVPAADADDYTVVEVLPEELEGVYAPDVSGNASTGFTIENTHENETVTISGSKTWNDNKNQDGVRPESITINLVKIVSGQTDPVPVENKTVKPDDEGHWNWSFTVPKYERGGQEIVYAITEDEVEGYTPTVTGYDVTNTHETETVTISGSKTWIDNDDQDGVRPKEITINLMKSVKDGDPVFVDSQTVKPDDEGNWNWSFTAPKYENQGQEISYFITEDAIVDVEGNPLYTSTVTGYNVTNTHTPETVTISGSKTWEDNDDQDGVRPKEITINLMKSVKDGDPVFVDSQTVKPDDEGNWNWSFTAPKYENQGQEISYFITEDDIVDVEGNLLYTATVTGYDVTNTHVPATTSVTVTKIWEDNGNQDNKRPEQVTVKLRQTVLDENGEEVTTDVIRDDDDAVVTLDADGNWTYTWKNLPVNESGQKITYSVVETDVDDYYDVSYRSVPDEEANIVYLTVTNTPKAYETTSVTITKVWDDNNDQDGKRPDSITVKLMDNESVLNTYEIGLAEGALQPVVSEDGNTWTYTITGLTKNSAGELIVYTIAEDQVIGYNEPDITGDATNGYTITNKHVPETVTFEGTKTWIDNENQDNKRPESITVKLMNGETAVATAEVSKETGWKYSFTAPKYSNGTEIKYYIAEVAVDGYTTAYSEDGLDIINTHAPEKTSVTVRKVWDDMDNQDNLRPESIIVYLMNGEEVIDTAEITEAEDGTWSHTFENLDKFSNGQEIQYTVTEEPVAEYDTDISQVEDTNTFVITNTHSPAVIEKITVTKDWKDDNNSDGSRPDGVTVNLVKTVNGESSVVDSLTLSDANGWTGAFTNLPKFDNGKEILYTITEDAVPGYATVITGSAAEGFTVTNTHNPATVCISGAKYWLDNFDQDGIRPDSVTIRLYANGKYVGKQVVSRATYWTYSFCDLPMYENGEPIVYTITEDPVKGYVTTYTVTPFGYDVTNTHVPAVTAIGGTKVWDDANDQDGKRPDYIVVNLYANGIYITSQVVSEATNWSWAFGPLAKYYDHGKLVIYTVTENAVDGYTTVIKGNKIINSYTPEETSVTVMKVWDDADNQDGIRANDIVVKLLADGKDTGKTAVLSAGNDWTATFTGLDKYRDGGIEIVYTVEEVEVPAGYEVSYSIDADSIKVVNTHAPETVDISGAKTWDDNDNQDGKRPEYITIRLYADGLEVASKMVTAGDDWSWSFEGLPKYRDGGILINYSITEDVVAEYTAEVDGFDVTNTHTPGKTFVNVIKTWNDKDNQDGIRPDSVTVHLYANGEATDKYLTLNAENGWTGVFSDLDEYQNGVAVQYTIKEIAVEGYDTAITGDAATGYTISNTHDPETVDVAGSKTWDDADNQDGKRSDSITVNLLANGVEIDEAVVTAEDGWTYSFEDLPKFENGTEITYTITEDLVEGYTVAVNGYDLVNSYTPGKTTVTVTKAWSDSNDKDGLRPDSVTIRLLANGVDTGKTLVLTAEGKWTGIFTDLDEYSDGEKIVYTVAEDVVKGYNAVISGDATTGFIVTNSHTTTPKTGDSAMPFLMGGIGAAALVLFLGLLLAKRKKEEY